jgi:hypothetical protein
MSRLISSGGTVWLTLVSSISLPSISSVPGSFQIASNGPFNCASFGSPATFGNLGPNFTCRSSGDDAPSEISPSSSSSHSLSTGAKAGIGLGSALGFILCCRIVWYIFERFVKKKKSTSDTEEGPTVPELSAEKADAELEAGHGQSEMLGQGQASGYVDAFELPGSIPER